MAGFFYKIMNQLTAEDNFVTLEQRVKTIAEDVLSDVSHFVVLVIVRGVRGSRVVEVFIDGDQGVNIDTLARYSREISFALDTEDFIDGKYKLEVSSPGLDRPLVLPRQYTKHIERSIKIKVQQPEGNKTLKGVLVAADADQVQIKLANGTVEEINFADVLEAKVMLPW